MRLNSANEYSSHLDNVQNDLDSLKDLLSNESYQLDANQLLGVSDAEFIEDVYSMQMVRGEITDCLPRSVVNHNFRLSFNFMFSSTAIRNLFFVQKTIRLQVYRFICLKAALTRIQSIRFVPNAFHRVLHGSHEWSFKSASSQIFVFTAKLFFSLFLSLWSPILSMKITKCLCCKLTFFHWQNDSLEAHRRCNIAEGSQPSN